MLRVVVGVIAGMLAGAVALWRLSESRLRAADADARSLPVLSDDEKLSLVAALRRLGFSRAALLTGSDRANRYLVVPESELDLIGQEAARAQVEPLFPGAKAEFLAEQSGTPTLPLFGKGARP